MSFLIACPGCKCSLRVFDDVNSRWLTCPRCLGSVGNPRVLDGVVASPIPVPEVPSGAGDRSCPSCGRPAEAGWQLCPYCEAWLPRESRPGDRRRSPPDDEVRRDSRGAKSGLFAIGLLLILGAVLFLTLGSRNLLAGSKDPEKTVLVFGTIVLGIFVIGLIALGVGSSSTAGKIVTGVVGGFATGAGIIILLIAAACIGIANTCSNFGSPRPIAK
jgi:hypothetical protein